MVALRVTIGWHFFYEGVWKIAHPQFSAEGFLKNAKGPAAPLFYAMMPDIDGHKRLATARVPVADELRGYWHKLRDDAEIRTNRALVEQVKDEAEKEAGREKVHDFKVASERLLWNTEEALSELIADQRTQIQSAIETIAEESGDVEEDAKQQAVERLKASLDRLHQIEQPYLEELAKLKAEAVGGEPPSYGPRVPTETEDLTADQLVSGQSLVGVDGKTLLSNEREVVGPERTYVARWEKLLDRTIDKFKPSDEQRYQMQSVFHRYKDSVETVLEENEVDIASYFDALARHRAEVAAGNNPPFQQKRNWDEMQKLRGEVGQWTGELDQMEQDYMSALWNTLDDEQKNRGDMPSRWSQTELINLAVTWGLTAIGLCLMIGLATRPAALGGGVFLIFVLLTQPPWPTIYPPAPEVVGHALIVDKNFVEMVAVFLLAASPVGRWAGLDYFLENFVIRRWQKYREKK